MKVISQPECIWDLKAELGEGALWSAHEDAVWFVDIKGRKVHRLADGKRTNWDAPQQVGFIVPAHDGGWVAGLQSGLHRFDPKTGKFTAMKPPEQHSPAERLNDGFVDNAGRLWFGTMHDSEQGRTGKLYRLMDDGSSRVQDAPYAITNGPTMSPDGKTLYHTETIDKIIYAFDVARDGSLSNKREFARVTRGNPDGPCVDAEGCVWSALFGGSGLARFSPKGELLGYVEMPVPNVTKAAFGGAGLTTLYVTTARLHMDDAAKAAHPQAGGLFRLKVDVPGLPQHEIRHGL